MPDFEGKQCPESVFRFGLSLNPGAGGAAALPELPEIFEMLELPGSVLETPEALHRYLKREEFTHCDFRDLIPARLSREVTGESRAIVTEYKEQLRKLLLLARDFGAQGVGIDPDWEVLSTDHAATAVWNDILRATAGDRALAGVTLRIPIRIPGASGRAAAEMLPWLHRLANYRLAPVPDINPHELLNRKIDWDAVLEPFRFEVDTVRFCYESELGNRLLYSHVAAILQCLRRWRRELAIYLAPTGPADLKVLAELIREAEKEAA